MKLLVKEIRSRTGELHFRRWRLLQLPWFAIYVHGIYKSDEDHHPHSHPWNFLSLILKGSYWEYVTVKDYAHCGFDGRFYWEYCVLRRRFGLIGHTRESYHHIELEDGPVYTLVFTFGRHGEWGYLVGDKHVDYREYRAIKEAGGTE